MLIVILLVCFACFNGKFFFFFPSAEAEVSVTMKKKNNEHKMERERERAKPSMRSYTRYWSSTFFLNILFWKKINNCLILLNSQCFEK